MLCSTIQHHAKSGMWVAAVVVLVLLLAACGGGGSGIAPSTPQPQSEAKVYSFGVASSVSEFARADFLAVRGADGHYVIQPVTVTIQVPYISIVHQYVITIERRITTTNRILPITLEGGRVIKPGNDTPGEGVPSPTPPPSDEEDQPVNPPTQEDEGGTPTPAPPGEGGAPAPAPTSFSLVMAKVEFRYSDDADTFANQTIDFLCFSPNLEAPGGIAGVRGRSCEDNREPNAKLLESYFMFPDMRNNPSHTITLNNQVMSFSRPTVSISMEPGSTVINTIVHNSWVGEMGNQFTNFYIPDFVTVTGEAALASMANFETSEFGRGDSTVIGWHVGRFHIHNFCNGFSHVNPVISVSFRYWQRMLCPQSSGASPKHTPNKSDIASGALQDIGARGFAFADSPAKFYARWGNKEKRKQAGFSYNFDTFALRTDYNKLPAAQDSGVMLDTYRVGIIPDIGKRHRLFAGVDNYRNGILAIQYSDAADTDTHTNIYKLGSVAGKGGYAVKFEWRIVWE